MKTNKFFASLLVAAAFVAACGQAPVANPEPGEDGYYNPEDIVFTKGEIDTVSYLAGFIFGDFIKGRDFGELNRSQILAGANDMIKSKGNPRDTDYVKQFKISPELIDQVFNTYLQKRRNLKIATNHAAELKFLETYAAKEGVQATEDGILYIIVEPGDDVRASQTDTIWVNYKGTLADGTVFDQTPEGAEPVQMMLNYVVPGWQKTIPLIGQGGEMTICVPSKFAYGDNGTYGIDPCSALVFDIKLSKIGKVAPAAE